MNKIAIALYVVGALAIVGGIVIGLASYKVPIEGYDYITEESYSVLFTWIGAGLISGIMMFGFAEIVKLLDNILLALKGNGEKDVVGSKQTKNNSKLSNFAEQTLNK